MCQSMGEHPGIAGVRVRVTEQGAVIDAWSTEDVDWARARAELLEQLPFLEAAGDEPSDASEIVVWCEDDYLTSAMFRHRSPGRKVRDLAAVAACWLSLDAPT